MNGTVLSAPSGRGRPEVPAYWPSRRTVDYLTKPVANG